MTAPALPLPGGYWWSDTADRSVLYLRYGWVASVTATETEVRGARDRRLRGRCGSVAQGKRFVERWVRGQVDGTYRNWRARWAPPVAYVPTAADAAYAAIRAGQAAAVPPRAGVAAPMDEDWETVAWRADVPFDQVKALAGGDTDRHPIA